MEEARARAGRTLHLRHASLTPRWSSTTSASFGAPEWPRGGPQSWIRRMAGDPDGLKASSVAYLERLVGTHAPQTVTGRATHLAQFGRSWPRWTRTFRAWRTGPASPHGALAVGSDRSTSSPLWWPSPSRAEEPHPCGAPHVEASPSGAGPMSLIAAHLCKRPSPDPRHLPRYLPPEADRRLAEVLEARPHRIVARDALLLQRACGLRIGELLDLELDCVHEIPGNGSWLKVPLGKLMTERMVPLDNETVALIDRIVLHRSPGRPLRHPRSGRLVEFLFTHRGRRVSKQWLRSELSEAATEAGLDHAHPHQLRHTYATALVNAGCSLQALMALLGHVSAEMSLRYGRLFDQTVRESYERALTQAKASLGPVLPEATPVHLETDWRRAPLIKARLAGGYCLRSLAQGPCAYANICEHCPNLRSEKTFLPILRLQRVDAEALLADAEARGWGAEVARHRRLVERIDALIANADAG